MSLSPHASSVEIVENGRSGSVVYREASNSLSLFWEFGGDDTVAIIIGGDAASWARQHPWAKERRAEILRHIAEEAIRQKGPGGKARIDLQAGVIYLQQGNEPNRRAPAPSSVSRFKLYKIKAMIALILLIACFLAIAIKVVFSVPPSKGIPLGASLRAADQIVTLIQTQESYIPTLHRNPENDRYRLGLLVLPVDGSSEGRLIPIGKEYRGPELQLVRILGYDGRTVWCAINEIIGVDLKSNKLLGAEDLRQANPSLNEQWDDSRRISFDARLRVSTPDRQQTFEVDPESLATTPVAKSRLTPKSPFDPRLEEFLSSTVRPSPTEWLGLHSTREAEVEFKLKSWLSPINRATSAKVERQLHRGTLGPDLGKGKREVLSLAPLSPDTFLNACFVRTGQETEPLRLSNPDGFLFIYTSKPGLTGTLVVARVDTTGKVLWKTDTALDRFKLQQILPDERYVAFIGPELPIPDKFSPTILVIVNTQTGTARSTPLQR